MSGTINQRQLRNDSGAIMRAVEAGESFIVTRNGIPAAELRPVRRRVAVPLAEVLAGARRLAPLDAVRLRADVDEILDQTVDR